jgi:hypothetical protein
MEIHLAAVFIQLRRVKPFQAKAAYPNTVSVASVHLKRPEIIHRKIVSIHICVASWKEFHMLMP